MVNNSNSMADVAPTSHHLRPSRRVSAQNGASKLKWRKRGLNLITNGSVKHQEEEASSIYDPTRRSPEDVDGMRLPLLRPRLNSTESSATTSGQTSITSSNPRRIIQDEESDCKVYERQSKLRTTTTRSIKTSSMRNGRLNIKYIFTISLIASICLMLLVNSPHQHWQVHPRQQLTSGLGLVHCSPQVSKPASDQHQATTTTTGSFGCPYPAVNSNSQVNIVAQAPAVPLLSTEYVADEYATLKPDTQASYKCDHGFELLGQETLTCLQSGRWSGPPPTCVTNIALGKPTNQSSTVKGGDSRNANDGRLITQHDAKYCTETRVDQSPWWQIDLLQVYEIRSVRLLGRACCNPQLSLHDIEIRVGNSSTIQGNRLCAWYPNNLDEGVARDFQCANPIYGRFVSIQMVGIESALSLCEVMVFSTKEFPADRCNIQATLAPSSVAKPQSQPTTTTSATTTQQSSSLTGSADSQINVFNRTCYEIQATNGGSFLVADTFCKARGGSLAHSITDLTHNYISQELERMKTKLKSKLVWLGAKRDNASPNAQGPITPGSTSALVASDSPHNTYASDRSLSASLFEFPVESLFAPERSLLSAGEPSPIFSPLKLSRTSLLQVSSGAGGSTSRGSQTFGLATSGQHYHHHPTNRTIEHTGRSLSIIQPNQVASFLTPPVPIGPAPVTDRPAFVASPTTAHPSPPSSPISFSGSSHVHRSLRPPALVSSGANSQRHEAAAAAAAASTSWNTQIASSPSSLSSSNGVQSASGNSWRWVGDQASDSLMSGITSFLWAEDQPNNYNNQQDCIVMDGAKKWLWNDVTCELDYLPWVCQYRPSTCGSPDRNENSTILEMTSSSPQDGSSGSLDSAFQLGKQITYACPVGHKLEGSRTRKCLYDGSWSGKAPKCQYVNCGPIGNSQTIENGRIVYLNQSQHTYGSQVRYVCYEDYVLVGDDTRQCQGDGKWAGKQPFCAYKWCPVLQQISNGALNVSGYSENSIATYQCNSGYKLIGNDTRQCLLGGKWTNQEPFCQYVDCGQPKQIANGSHQLLNGTNYLSVVEYTCNANYTLVGNANRMICSHNNRWTGKEPQCDLIDCGPPQANAGSRFIGGSFTVHSTVDYKCDPGFKEVSGSSQRTCGLDGQWTGQPLSCKYVDCGRVPAILKGEVSYINGTTYLASQVTYDCTPGNRLSGHRTRFCGPDGRWTGSSPKCEEVRCEAPTLPANGSALYIGNDRSFKEQSFSVGVTVKYECDYGHVVTGTWSSRLCQANGEWSGEAPICKFVDCGTPPSIENGQYVLKHPPPGATIGSATPIEMMLPPVAVGAAASRRSDTVNTSPGAFTYYGTIAHYSCEPNFKLQGPAQRECLESGTWRTPLPTCEPIQCPKPEFFDEYTQVAMISRSTAEHMSTTTSSAGTATSDHQELIALANKASRLIANNQWLTNHQEGSNQLFGVGDKLYYSCVPGYELYGGPEIRTCTQYGQWSGSSTPRCRLIDCGRPSPIGQEGRFYLLNETTTFNSLVEYSCVRPFKLVEVKIRQAGNLIETLSNAQAGVTPILTSLPIGVKVCANNGQWMPNDQQPKCISGSSSPGGQSTPDAQSPTGGTNGGGGGQYDGADNTLDGSHRSVHVMTNTFNGGGGGANGNQDLVDGNNLDAAGYHNHQHHQQQANQQASSTSLWAKVIIAFCLLVMLALIILTLICIRSGRKPKQHQHQRPSILTPTGHHQAAAVAAIQLQLANGKGVAGMQQQQQQQQQQQLHLQQPNLSLHHHHQQAAAAAAQIMTGGGNTGAGQNIYLNGMHKMFPGSMVGQSQMTSAALAAANHSVPVMNPYGDDNNQHQVGGRSILRGDGSSASSNLMDTYSRLSIESDQTSVASHHNHHPSNKTIRHNPNGLVTFVSAPPAQQPGRPPQQTSSTGPSQHQVSPQSISTSLSVSSSSSPSSSSSAHHTTATRLSGTDSASSPSSGSSNQGQQHLNINGVLPAGGHHLNHHHLHHQHHQHHHHHHLNHHQQEENEYQAPQTFMHNQQEPSPASLVGPPSLPAHPPPPHRVQQHHKQLMKHQQHSSRQQAATTTTQATVAATTNAPQQQPNGSSSD